MEPVRYFYVVHGTIPELMPMVAYRRIGRERQCERKNLKCPICGKRLTDLDAGTCVELFKHPVRVAVQCQLYLKCYFCHCEVGIKIA
jgi:hypothetical protein